MSMPWDKLISSTMAPTSVVSAKLAASDNSIDSNMCNENPCSVVFNGKIDNNIDNEKNGNDDSDNDNSNCSNKIFDNDNMDFFGNLNKHFTHFSKWSLSQKSKQISAPPLFR